MGFYPYPFLHDRAGSSSHESHESMPSRCSSILSTRTTSSGRSSLSSIPSTPLILEHQPPKPSTSSQGSITGYSPPGHGCSTRNHRSGSRHRKAMPVRTSRRGDEDNIDALDDAAFSLYHHEGPYDAATPARNKIPGQSPVLAFGDPSTDSGKYSHEKCTNNLDGDSPRTEQVLPPPGVVDRDGRVYEYDDGSNVLYDIMLLQGPKFTDEDFANDPFYADPYPKPIKDFQENLAKFGRRVKRKLPHRKRTEKRT
ncbi:Pal1 cell morphology protein [Aspergillus sp. HF37]|nr:Pal1 cell morphology protein [Aspergillus sp. HF37]